MAINISYFLKQKYEEYQLNEVIKTEELYSDIPNEYLKLLFATLHQEFNRLYRFMYGKSNGHFNAFESRQLINYIKLYEDLEYVLRNTEFSFKINDDYAELIKQSKDFLVMSGGSSIPDSLKRIYLVDYGPIFKMQKSVKVISVKEEKNYAISLIGEGSYAKVFKYKDEFYNKTFIIKRAKKDLTEKELERFKKEYATMKELNSPYILDVYRYEDTNNEYYAEFADETIYDYIMKKNSTLSIDLRKSIVFQIFKAFSYIHNKGYLHRDISLTNILIVHYDDVSIIKVSDFGLVKEKNSTLTSTDSDVKGSLNDSNLAVIGFKNYSIEYETYALTRLILFVMTGKRNIEKIDNEKIKEFVLKGTNPDISKRYKNIEEMRKFFNNCF